MMTMPANSTSEATAVSISRMLWSALPNSSRVSPRSSTIARGTAAVRASVTAPALSRSTCRLKTTKVAGPPSRRAAVHDPNTRDGLSMLSVLDL